MLVFVKENLTFLAVPKTGTTAYEAALRGRADIASRGRLKHMNATRYHKKFAPFLADTYGLVAERMAVMRDPVDQIRSWYKYRSAPERIDSPKGTGGISFDAFLRDVIKDDPPPHAGLGSQFNFLTGPRGQLLVHSLFAYEAQDRLRAFLENRFGSALKIPQKNVSPVIEAELEPATLAALKRARAKEFALYDRLRDAGGYLLTDDI